MTRLEKDKILQEIYYAMDVGFGLATDIMKKLKGWYRLNLRFRPEMVNDMTEQAN